MRGRIAWFFTPNCEKSQGNIWNKISIFKVNAGGTSEVETLIEKVQDSSL